MAKSSAADTIAEIEKATGTPDANSILTNQPRAMAEVPTYVPGKTELAGGTIREDF